MFLPIPLPTGTLLTNVKRLHSHAAWYQREALRHGPTFGTVRYTRARQRRIQQQQLNAAANAIIDALALGPV